VANSLSYYESALITAVKRFIVWYLGLVKIDQEKVDPILLQII